MRMRRAGFTLFEILISLAIVVMVILMAMKPAP